MAQQITAVQEVSQTLMNMKPAFAEMLKKSGLDPDKFTRVAIMSVTQKPDLLQCNRQSLYNAISDCARDCLIPDNSEAAIVKFGTEAVYMPMVEGLLKLFRNSGECGTVDSGIVREKDEYESWTDEKGPHFRHKKYRGKDAGNIIMVYAYAITKDGNLYFEEMTMDEVNAVENIAKTKTIWQGAFRTEMMRKSPLRRLAKRLPRSTDIEMAIQSDNKNYELEEPEPDKQPEQTQSSRLSQAIDAQVVKPEPEPTGKPIDPVPEPVEPPQGTKAIRGVIKAVRNKAGVTNGKPWNRYGGQIDGSWYGTFDSKIYEVMSKAKTNNILVDVNYVEVVKDNKIYFECKAIREVTAGNDGQPADSGDIPF